MKIKTFIKIWYSLNWRVLVYSLTVYFYLISFIGMGILYCLNNGHIDQLRDIILSLFNLSDTQGIPTFSYSRILKTEGLSVLIILPLVYLALKKLPSIPFSKFRIRYQSLRKTFLIVGPLSFICYLGSYIGLCSILGHEDETLQTALTSIASLIFISYGFKDCVFYNDQDTQSQQN